MRKIISLFLVCIFIFTLSTPAFAAEEPVSGSEITDQITDTDITEVDSEEPADTNNYVVKLYLCITLNSLTGHLWLYFENLTDRELPLGYVTLQPYEEMSVGSLRNTRKDRGGTYYNGEAYMAKNLESVKNHTTSVSTYLTYEQLLTINEKIKGSNTYVLIGYNCGDFACKCWNSVAPKGKKVVNILVPLFTIAQVSSIGVKGEPLMKRPDETRIFKQEKNGVRQANTKSFRISCVNW